MVLTGDTGRFVGEVALGAIGGIGGRCPRLVTGRGRLVNEGGREGVPAGLSGQKKLDFRLRGDGVGGICERVSIVRSERDGLGRRRNSTPSRISTFLASSCAVSFAPSKPCAILVFPPIAWAWASGTASSP